MEKGLHYYTFCDIRLPSMHLMQPWSLILLIPISWLHKGITLTHLDLHVEAISAFDHVLALNPGHFS